MRTALCIPVLNPGADAVRLVEAIAGQRLRPDSILIIDSESDDDSLRIFSRLGATVVKVARSSFDHGGTRNLAFERIDADVYLFLTQDAIPANEDTFSNLVSSFTQNERIGVAYGRQIGREDASHFARHHRVFNYPPESSLRFKADIEVVGLRAAFVSNSFAAYRRAAIADVGYFPRRIIMGEDTYAAAKMLLRGWGVYYNGNAVVIHSHDYNARQEIARYFDLGVFHATNSWYRDAMGGPTSDGYRLVQSQLRHLSERRVPFASVRVVLRNGIRFLGYALGRAHALLPTGMSKFISANKGFWDNRRD